MAEPECQGCRVRDARIAELERRADRLEAQVRELLELLGRNASNSSLPPSANPPAAPKPVVKERTGRKPGGQPGHSACQRVRLPAERVKQVIRHLPKICARCEHPLPTLPGPNDPEPTWWQIIEVPKVVAHAIEHQGHARTCPECGTVTRAAIPAAVRRSGVGPNLAATMTYLAGAHQVSKRGVVEIVQQVFDAPVALGTVANVEREMSAALAPAHAEAQAAVRAAPAKNTDETGWKKAGKLCWLWGSVTPTAACLLIHTRRSLAGLQALLGETIKGVITSDRWTVYNGVPLRQRQICWAHLDRDFQAMIDRGGASRKVGAELQDVAEDVFYWSRAVRDGTLQRSTVYQYVQEVRPWFRDWLQRGQRCRCAKTAAVCRDLLRLEPALWTFARVEGVEPTNNAAERLVRRAVLWRKKSFGCHSEAGCRFVERILTAVQTLRLQGRRVLNFLVDTLTAHRASSSAPRLAVVG